MQPELATHVQIPRVETLNVVIALVLLCVFCKICQQKQQHREDSGRRGGEDIAGLRVVISEQRVGDSMFVRRVPQFSAPKIVTSRTSN